MYKEIQVYIGAYIEITKLPTCIEEMEEKEFTFPECTKKCEHSYLHLNAKFCPSCGKAIQLVTQKSQITEEWDMANISHEFDKSFLWANSSGLGVKEIDKILIPHGSGKWGKYYDDYGFGIKDTLPKLDNPEGILKTKFFKELARLEKIGAKYVLKTGILVFYV